MDDTADMVKVAHRLMQFYQNESCGKCTPCREGTRWVVQILERIASGKGNKGDLENIDRICRNMEQQSFCPLAVGAAPPVMSAIMEFREEFERTIRRNIDWEERPDMKIAYPYLVEE
jgi:NADH-quinone oxidoreductase subunit F